MGAMNKRQKHFLSRVEEYFRAAVWLAKEGPEIEQQWSEEFDATRDNDFAEAEAEEFLESLGHSSSDINTAISRFVEDYMNFWENRAVTTREYGRFARRVARQTET